MSIPSQLRFRSDPIEYSVYQCFSSFLASVLSQKLLYTERHSGLDPESSLFNWIPAPRLRGDKFTPAKAGAGMTTLIIIVKNC